MAGTDNKRGTIAACLVLALATLALYLPSTHNGFVNLDDNEYIVDNPHINTGITWEGMVWALRVTGYASNWHPLTWMSHMLDCDLFGLHPAGHHLMSVLLHVLNSVLVLLLFRQMTGNLWRSAFVAALFAWHPLHVESVAWASERKDVLSTLFWLLTTMAYVKYARVREADGPAARSFYCLSLVFFMLGLMSKAMLVTLPFGLLLLDWWPLRRISDWRIKIAAAPDKRRDSPLWLVWEKAPFFALAFGASLLTYLVQQTAGAVSSLEEVSVPRRAANIAVTYLRYFEKTLWPVNLAAFYPYPRHQSLLLVIISVVFLAVVTALCVLGARRRPYLFMGWFWFLGTLVPTIGLVQVGSQSMADRYMYVPSLGLFAMLVWGSADFLEACLATGEKLAAAGGVAALAFCLVCTTFQIGTWHDSERLYRHAIAVTKDNYVAYNGLGGALDAENRPDEALTNYFKGVSINPRYPEGQYNLGTALLKLNRLDEATAHLKLALKGNPDYVQAYNNLGTVYMDQSRLEDSANAFAKAVQIQPNYFEAYGNLGIVLMRLGRTADAITQFARAVELKPEDAWAHANLGVALMRAGQNADGAVQLSEAVRLMPTNAPTHLNYGLALMELNRPAEAAAQFSETVRLEPGNPKAHFNLAVALARQHLTKDAVSHYRAAVGLKPDFADALNNLAWILATDPNPDQRDSREALQLAQKACELTNSRQPAFLLTLAAAQAAAGQFPEAASVVQKARDLALADGDTRTGAKADVLLKLFEVGEPFHESE